MIFNPFFLSILMGKKLKCYMTFNHVTPIQLAIKEVKAIQYKI